MLSVAQNAYKTTFKAFISIHTKIPHLEWGVRGKLVRVISLFPSVHHPGPKDGTQVVRHGSNHLPTADLFSLLEESEQIRNTNKTANKKKPSPHSGSPLCSCSLLFIHPLPEALVRDTFFSIVWHLIKSKALLDNAW